MAKALKTPTSVWTAVFRRIIQQLKNDPAIKRVVGLDHLRSWEGVPADKSEFAPSSNAPVVRLTPQPRNVDWYSPDMQSGELWVQVELAVQTLCIDDVADLWDIVVAALQPAGPAVPTSGNSFAQDLVTLGAETGEIVFSDPAFDPQPQASDDGFFFAGGHFRLRVLRREYP
jgi:hypothetical protein